MGRVRSADKEGFRKESPMENAILIVVMVAILGGAVAYIVKAKRNGVKCIGCSAGGSCGGKKGDSLQGGCGCCSGCNGGSDDGGFGCGCHEERK